MKKKQSDVEDFAISLFEEFGLPAAEAEEPADERSYDSACLARQESVRNLCRKVVTREKLMTEPVLREIFSALRRADKKGYRSGSCAEAELIRKAVGHYIRDRANEYIIELKKVEGQRIEDLSGKGREAYEELLFLLRGLYDDKLMLKPDEGTSHYRTDPWTSESCGTPILLRDFSPEKKGRYEENRIVLYPELKPGKRGSSWTNSYTMYDGYAAASHIAADLIKRTADQNARCGVTVYAYIKEALIEKMKRRQPARIVFDKNLLVDRRAVIAFLRQNGLDVADASDYPETQSLYPHCTSIPGDYLRILFGGEYTDISAALSERWDTDTEMLGKALRLFYEEYESDLLYEKYEKTTAHTYAEVYQDKKNIPETVQTAMKESPFHRYFGYVEYDQMVDREAVKEVYRDFEAVARTFFNDMKVPDYEIRFRFLGRHRAAGIYYSTLRCLCVDLRYPSSLAHEFFHLYDYDQGCLSDGLAFRPVRRKYEELLRKWERGHKEEARTLKGKYDLDYYLTPTEIFARCGEMYLVRVRGVRNSIVAEALSGFEYPEDPELMELLKNYFDGELSKGRLLPALRPEVPEFLADLEASAS